MHISSHIHLTEAANVTAEVARDGNGARYLVLTITDDMAAYPTVTIFPAGPEFLDKLSNECERAVREFVGDVPPAPYQECLDGLGETQTAEALR